MKKANISYTRNHLSEILARVREGESILILDRNQPIARLEPVDGPLGEAAGWRGELVRRGILNPSKGGLDIDALAAIPAPEPKSGGDILGALGEDREESFVP